MCETGFPSCRLLLVVMGFLAIFNHYTFRVNLSITIVAMVNTTYLHELEASSSEQSNSTSGLSHKSNHADDNMTLEVDNEVSRHKHYYQAYKFDRAYFMIHN